jgi:hypothetical protein
MQYILQKRKIGVVEKQYYFKPKEVIGFDWIPSAQFIIPPNDEYKNNTLETTALTKIVHVKPRKMKHICVLDE